MKKIVFLLSYLLTFLSQSQLYDNLVISDKKNPDDDNLIFVPGRVFTYSVESTSLGLPKNVIYTVVGIPKSKRTIKNQTEVVISYEPDMRKYHNTGIVENESNIWLHPPRSGSFRVLETCPFPYIKFPLSKGLKWEDQLIIGDQWSLGLWQGKMLFDITYEVTGKQQFKIDNIMYDCWLIKSTANSEAGKSELTIVYHEDEGFMELTYETLKGQRIVLNLESTIQEPVYRNMRDYFSDKLTQSK